MADVHEGDRAGWGGAIIHGVLLVALAVALWAVFRAGVGALDRREQADRAGAVAPPDETDRPSHTDTSGGSSDDDPNDPEGQAEPEG